MSRNRPMCNVAADDDGQDNRDTDVNKITPNDRFDIRYRTGRLERDRLYRLAKRKSYRLQMCRRQNEDRGTYHLLTRNTNTVVLSARIDGYGLTLDRVEAFLARHAETNVEKAQ